MRGRRGASVLHRERCWTCDAGASAGRAAGARTGTRTHAGERRGVRVRTCRAERRAETCTCVCCWVLVVQWCALCGECARRAGGRVRESLRCLCAHAGRSAVLEGCVLVWSCCELELWQYAWVNYRPVCSRAGELAARTGCAVGAGALRAGSRLQLLHVTRAGSAARAGVLHAIANARSVEVSRAPPAEPAIST